MSLNPTLLQQHYLPITLQKDLPSSGHGRPVLLCCCWRIPPSYDAMASHPGQGASAVTTKAPDGSHPHPSSSHRDHNRRHLIMCTSTVAGGHTPTRMATQTAVTATISCYYCSGHFYNCDIIGRMVTHTMSQPTRATPVLHTPSTVASRSHTLLQSIPHRVAA